MPILGIIASSRSRGVGPIALNGAGFIFVMRKDGSGTYANTSIQKFDFTTESRTTLGAVMPDTSGAAAGFANGTVAGYIAGGISSGTVALNTTQKLLYSTEARTQIGNTFNNARFNNKGFTNTEGTSGYMGSGQDLSVFLQSVRKLTYSTEAWSNVTSSLPVTKAGSSSFSNPSLAGFWAGGYDGSAPSLTVNKMPFSTETVAVTTALAIATNNGGALSDTGHKAYIFNGWSSSVTQIVKWTYATDTNSATAYVMADEATFSAYMSCPGQYGAVAGARLNPYPNVTDAIQKIAYATDVRTASASVLAIAGETSNYGTSSATLGA